jgi:hypothetical protein
MFSFMLYGSFTAKLRLMTFVNDPSDRIRLRNNNNPPPVDRQPQQQPQVQQPPGTVAIGFWADYQTYKKYQKYAIQMHNQIVTDENGREKRLLERPDVNELLHFAVEYFINVSDWTTKMQESGNFMGMLKGLIKQMGPM